MRRQKSRKKLLIGFALRAGFIFFVDCHDFALQNLAMTDFLDSWLKVTTIEVMAVWLCTAIFPLLGNKSNGLLTKQGGNRRVNRIPQDKLPIIYILFRLGCIIYVRLTNAFPVFVALIGLE